MHNDTANIIKNKPSSKCRAVYLIIFGNFNSLSVVLLHDLDEVDNLVRVTNLIVVPRNNLNELVSQVNTCVSVED